jgi:thiamine biosynthesis lipoprotein
MGSTYNIKYWTKAESAPAPPEVQRSIDALLARFDEQVSTWRPDSEISRFNAAPAGEWFPVSRATADIVARAIELHRLTDGASDVTVGPVLRLWGFGAGTPKQRGDAPAPSDDKLNAARALLGVDRLGVRTDPPALRKDAEGLEVDLSSIAAGYAIDLVVDDLSAAGIDNATIEMTGEVRGVGLRPDGRPWRVGVQAPPPSEKSIAQVLPLADLALATSGDFHNVHMVGGQRVTHIIDPRTGRPLPYRGASVTVVADDAFAADGVATALFVMGPDAGYDWCVEHKVAALFLDSGAEGQPMRHRTTPRFDELVPHDETPPRGSTQ